MSYKEPETCEGCLFYLQANDDTGTCTISENITEPTQETCIDYKCACGSDDTLTNQPII